MTHTPVEFIKLVAQMRDLQKRYFAAVRQASPGKAAILSECKEAEKKVDAAILRASQADDTQLALFGQ